MDPITDSELTTWNKLCERAAHRKEPCPISIDAVRRLIVTVQTYRDVAKMEQKAQKERNARRRKGLL